MRDGKPGPMRLGLAAVLVFAFVTLAAAQTNPPCGTPATLDDGWTIVSPENVGIDSAQLCTVEPRLKLTDSDIHAVAISRDAIMQSVIPRFQAIGYFGGTLFYGYQWWLGRSLAEGKEVRWITTFWGVQRIFVVPSSSWL